MDSPTLFQHWNILPNEIKVRIVKNLDLSSRLALRSCSVDDWKLVESVPFRKMNHLSLTETRQHKYKIFLEENYYSEAEHCFDNFEEFQEKLLKILDNADYITNLSIYLENTMEKMNLMPRNRKIIVKELLLNMHRPEDCLQQLDATFLKKILLISERKHVSDELCDMPQFNSVDELEIRDSYIRDDQLWKIKSKKFSMNGSRNLTAFGIYNYIKKRTFDPNLEKLQFGCLGTQHEAVIKTFFKGQYQEWEWFVHPSLPEFETFITYQQINFRRIRTNSTESSSFKKLEYVRIGHGPAEDGGDIYDLYIKKNSNSIVPIKWLEKFENIQNVLTEKLANINYIKELTVFRQGDTHCWRLLPVGSLNRITVGHLTLNCDTSNKQLAIDLLEQIEPGHLKFVELDGENIPNDVFNMQQVIQADHVKVPHSNIQDYQLMKLSATRIDLQTSRNQLTNFEKITASGVNKFIKKCLVDLNKRNYEFELILLCNCRYPEFVSTLLEGLDIFSMKIDQKIDEEFYPSEVIVNSDFDGFKLKLDIDGKYLKGKRIHV